MGSDLTPDELSQLIFTDDLTGIYNRRYLYSYLTRRIDWKDRSRPLSLMMCDLDHFKSINDGYGHLEGDHAVRTLTAFLRELVRPEDVLVRYGGDEFCALLPGVDRTQALQIAETVRTRVAGHAFTRRCDGQEFKITISVGVATFPDHAQAPDRLIDESDKALYESKHRGRNRSSSAGELDPAVAAARDPFVGLPCPVLVGRAPESERIRNLLSELRRGRSGLVLFKGAAGSGKTRMLREITRWAKDEGMIYLLARCTEALMDSPYKILFQLVESYIGDERDSAERLSKRLAPHELAVLREFIPSLRDVPLTETVVLDERDRRRALYEGLIGILWDMGQHQPLVLLLDNLEFADRGTLEVLRWLLRPGAARVLLAGAMNLAVSESESFRDSFLAQFFEEARRNGALTSIDLAPLAPKEIAQMVRSMLPDSEYPGGFEKLIAEAAAGNPLYVEESIRSLLLKGKIVKEGVRWKISPIAREDLPPSLEAAIQQVFAQLPRETAEFLTNAAVVGGDFDLRLLKEVMGTNLGRAQEAADRARDMRLVVPTAGESRDEYAFSNRKSQETRYRTTPEPQRQEIHGRIARVEETRHKDASEVADLLAYHYEKGGDPRKADEYRQINSKKTSLIYRAEEVSDYQRRPGQRQARVAEGTQPPTPAVLKKTEAFLRAFCGTLKMRRLYPQWSQLSETFMAQLQSSFAEMMAEGRTVTFVSDQKRLRVNGTLIDGKGGATSADDMARILHDHLIAGLTLAEGCAPEELELLVGALVNPLDRAGAKPDHWDAFLDANRVKNFDIVQRTYVPHEVETGARSREPLSTKERLLEKSELAVLAAAVRHLKAGVDNMKLYPPGHQLVESALDGAFQTLGRLLATAPAATLGETDSGLVANGAPLDPKLFGDAAEGLAHLIRAHKLQSVSFVEGLTRDEVAGFLSGLSLRPEEADWKRISERIGRRHLRIGERVFQLQQTGRREAAPAQAPKDPVSQARDYLGAPPSELLTDRFGRDLPAILEALLPGADAPLGRELIDRLLRWTGDVDPVRRRRVWTLFRDAVTALSAGPRRSALEYAAPMMTLRLGGETGAEPWRLLLSLLETWMRDLAARERWDSLLNVVGPLRARISRPGFDPGLGAAAEALLSELNARGVFAPLLEKLATGTAAEGTSVSALLGAVGPAIAASLVKLIPEIPSFPARQAAHAALRQANLQAVADVVRGIDASTPVETGRRILEVVDLSGVKGTPDLCLGLMTHPNREMRAEALRLIRRLPVDLAGEVLKRMLEIGSKELQLSAMSCAADLHIGTVAEPVIRLLGGTQEDSFATACCQYLGKVPAPAALETLARILKTRRKFFGLGKGFGDETRAAAAWALGSLGGSEARKILEAEAVHDRSPAVRSAAKMSLK